MDQPHRDSKLPEENSPPSTDKGKGRVPPRLPRKKGTPLPRAQKPQPVPGKYAPLINFAALREETQASTFTLQLRDAFTPVISQIAERSEDALIRMSYSRIDASSVETSLRGMANIYLAHKLIKTAAPSDSAALGALSGIEKTLEKCPIPTPLVDVINTIGNFETTDEIWRMNNLVHQVYDLLTNFGARKSDDIVIRSKNDWQSFTKMYPASRFADLPVNLRLSATESQPVRMLDTFDYMDSTAVTDLAARCETGTALGQKDEVDNRPALLTALHSLDRPSTPAARTAFASQMLATFGVTIRFADLRPSEIKQLVADHCSAYALRYRQPLARVWTMSGPDLFTDSGSPAQLISFNNYRHRGDCPAGVTPSDYALTAVIDLLPTITSRPHSSWSHTQDKYRSSLTQFVLDPSSISE